jgi:hypothetical protein
MLSFKSDIMLYSVDSDNTEHIFASKTLFLTGRKGCSFCVPLIGLAIENLSNNSSSFPLYCSSVKG